MEDITFIVKISVLSNEISLIKERCSNESHFVGVSEKTGHCFESFRPITQRMAARFRTEQPCFTVGLPSNLSSFSGSITNTCSCFDIMCV